MHILIKLLLCLTIFGLTSSCETKTPEITDPLEQVYYNNPILRNSYLDEDTCTRYASLKACTEVGFSRNQCNAFRNALKEQQVSCSEYSVNGSNFDLYYRNRIVSSYLSLIGN
jgi:hypothetical protein